MKSKNRFNSKICSRVEHVFGFIERSMGGLVFRGIGIVRAKANVALRSYPLLMVSVICVKRCCR